MSVPTKPHNIPDPRKLSEELEPSADIHAPQADGIPDDDSSIEGEVESNSKTGGA